MQPHLHFVQPSQNPTQNKKRPSSTFFPFFFLANGGADFDDDDDADVNVGSLRLSLELVQGHGNVPSSSSEKGQKGLNGFAPIWG